MKTYTPSTCFKGKNISYRDSDIDEYFSKKMPVISGTATYSKDLSSEMTFKEMANEFCGTDNESKLESCCFSLPQIERLLESDHVLTDGYVNLFLVYDKGNVFGLYAFRFSDGWHVSVYQFDSDRRWFAGRRFFFRNSFRNLDSELNEAIQKVKDAGYIIYKQI